jgi:hypothetical protein
VKFTKNEEKGELEENSLFSVQSKGKFRNCGGIGHKCSAFSSKVNSEIVDGSVTSSCEKIVQAKIVEIEVKQMDDITLNIANRDMSGRTVSN